MNSYVRKKVQENIVAYQEGTGIANKVTGIATLFFNYITTVSTGFFPENPMGMVPRLHAANMKRISDHTQEKLGINALYVLFDPQNYDTWRHEHPDLPEDMWIATQEGTTDYEQIACHFDPFKLTTEGLLSPRSLTCCPGCYRTVSMREMFSVGTEGRGRAGMLLCADCVTEILLQELVWPNDSPGHKGDCEFLCYHDRVKDLQKFLLDQLNMLYPKRGEHGFPGIPLVSN